MASHSIWKWRVTGLAIVISMMIFGLLAILYGLQEEGLRHQIRWSGRISFTLFCLSFGASGFHDLVKSSSSWWFMMNRKYIGISFAIVHLIHLLFIIILQTSFHPVFDLAATSSLIGGGVAYGFVVIMLITSFDNMKVKLSPSVWRVVHTMGGYWIGTIFFTTYFKRAETEPIHWLFLIVLFGVVLLRLRKRYRKFTTSD